MNGKELFRGLSYISRRYIDEAEFGTLSSAQNAPAPAARTRLRRPLLIAALIALLLLLVGCGAAYIITRNLNWSKELEKDLRFYNEDISVGAVSKGWVLDEAMFTLSAAPPENGNVTITCGEWSLDATGTLDIGTEYWIEKWNGTTYEEIPTLDAQPWTVPEQQIICGSNNSWTVNYLEKYGALEPGNYRIGMMVSKASKDGEPAQLGCFAKFRIPDPAMAPYLDAYNKAFQALKNAEAYHIIETSYNSRMVSDLEFSASREEYWKSGNDWVECRVIQGLDEEDFRNSGGGQMRRDGIGYGVSWPIGKVTDKPSSWERLTFVDQFECDLWCIFFEYVSQNAVDVQATDNYVNFIKTLDNVEYNEVRVFYDETGGIQHLEYSLIPGLAYEEADRILWSTLDVLPTTAQEAAAVLRAIDLDSPSQFSYAQDLEQIKSDGLVQKTGGFKNTTAQTSVTIDSASRLAAAEIPVDKTNIQSVFYDPEAKIWKVEFCYSQNDDIYYAVYLNADGIPQLVVSK